MSLYGTYQWSKYIRPQVLARDGFRCQIRLVGVCGNLDGRSMSPDKMEVDHIKPRSQGGGDELSNLRASCIPCNRYRAGKDTARDFNSREW